MNAWNIDSFDSSSIGMETESDSETDLGSKKWSGAEQKKIFLLTIPPMVLIPLTATTYLPAYHNAQTYFSTSNFLVIMTLVSYTFFTGIMPLIYGPISDRLGRKILLLSLLVAFFGSSLISAASTSIYWLIVGRGLMAISNGGIIVICTAIIYDVFPEDKRATMVGLGMVPTMLGPIIGPIIGGLMVEWFGWRGPIFFLSILILLSIATTSFISETHHHIVNPNSRISRPPFNPLRPFIILKEPKTLIAEVSNALSFGCCYTLLSLFPGIMGDDNISPFYQGLYLVPFGLGAMLGALIGGKLSDKFKLQIGIGSILSVCVGASFSVIISSIIFGLFAESSALTGSAMLFFVGLGGMAFRNGCMSFVIALSPENVAAATGTVLFSQFFCVVLELLLSSYLTIHIGLAYTCSIFAVLIIVPLPLLLLIMKKMWRKKLGGSRQMAVNDLESSGLLTIDPSSDMD